MMAIMHVFLPPGHNARVLYSRPNEQKSPPSVGSSTRGRGADGCCAPPSFQKAPNVRRGRPHALSDVFEPFSEVMTRSAQIAELAYASRHQTCHFRKSATAAPAEGLAYGLYLARRCEFPLRALQAQNQKWLVHRSRTFGAAWCDSCGTNDGCASRSFSFCLALIALCLYHSISMQVMHHVASHQGQGGIGA